MTHKSITSYVNLFENLSDEMIENIEKFISPEIYFKDPFNEVTGVEKFRKILHKTLHDVESPLFIVSEITNNQNIYFLKWRFDGKIRGYGDWYVTGVSEIHLNEKGLVNRHIDYWDSSEYFYMKIPIIGSLLRLIRRRLQVS